MNEKDNYFNSYNSTFNSSPKDKLPLESGLPNLFKVFIWRFLPIFVASIPSIFLLTLSMIFTEKSQIVSAVFLLLASIIVFLFTLALFRKKARSIDKYLKRLFDISFCLFSLFYLGFFILCIALLIIIDSGNPVFIKSKRIGKDGRVFDLFRFRTTLLEKEQKLDRNLDHPKEESISTKNLLSQPSKIYTRIGKILRKLSLDELPQIFNVLQGDMSLVNDDLLDHLIWIPLVRIISNCI